MPLTVRSQVLSHLLPALRAGIRATRLPADEADDALQQSLVALVPHLERLAAMPQPKRFAYVFLVGSRTAQELRKRAGPELRRVTDEEVEAWDRDVAERSVTPEHVLRAAEGAEHADRAFSSFDAQDQKLVEAVNDDGLSEREAALELGISRGSVAYRLRLAREALGRAWLGTTSWNGRKKRG